MSFDSKAAYERISLLFDEGSFIETGALITGKDSSLQGDGVVTGYGTVNGRLAFCYSENPEAAGGSLGQMHARKISAITNMAVKTGAPLIGIIDSNGVRVSEGNDSLWSFGKLFSYSAKASGVIPRIAVIYGNCGGGMSVNAALSDFVFMENDAKLFMLSPDAVKDNFTEKCDTASAKFRYENTALCDFAGTKEEISEKVRELMTFLPQNNEQDLSEVECTDDLNRSTEGISQLKDKKDMLKEIADDEKFIEFKGGYSKSMVTGFIKLNGKTVGACANNCDEMCSLGAEKAASFIRFCDAFNIPLLTLCDVKGVKNTVKNEKRISKSLAQLAEAYASLSVPAVTCVTGKAYGTCGIIMGSKAVGADICFALSDARMGLMEKEQMDKLTEVNKDKDIYSAQYNAEEGYIDDIIDPAELRQRLCASFEMLYTKSVPLLPRKHSAL